jgi:hypothetical protein
MGSSLQIAILVICLNNFLKKDLDTLSDLL